MGKVCIKGLAKREVGAVVVDSAVDRTVGEGNVLILETSEKFLKIANALSTASRLTPRIIICRFLLTNQPCVNQH
jgi:hypothetical protein